MTEAQLQRLSQWAQEALDDYYADAYAGEPEYPQFAADLLELIKIYRASVAHNEMLAARLRMSQTKARDQND